MEKLDEPLLVALKLKKWQSVSEIAATYIREADEEHGCSLSSTPDIDACAGNKAKTMRKLNIVHVKLYISGAT